MSRLLLLWIALALGSGALLLIDTTLGLSLLWGFSVSLLPGICFAWFSYRGPWGARRTAAVLSAIYRAEAIKFFLTVVLFAAVFMQVDKIYPSVVFLAFIGAHICSWVLTAQALIRRQQ